MPQIDLGYLTQSFAVDGWDVGGLALTFDPDENTYPHPDLDAAADPRGNLLHVTDPLTHDGTPVSQYSQDFQEYLDGRSLFLKQLRPMQAIYADFAALNSTQQNHVKAFLFEVVPYAGLTMPRYQTSNNQVIWASAPAVQSSKIDDAWRSALCNMGTFWALENPGDFVTPPWDSSINIPGDAVV